MRYATILTSTLLLWFGLGDARGASTEPILSADPPGMLGESGSLFLLPPGIFLNPAYNDYAGNTDKHLTQSIRTTAFWNMQDDGPAFALAGAWRYMTPGFKSRFGTPTREDPPGRFADWAEIDLAGARAWRLGVIALKQQVTFGYNHLGPKGAREIQRAIHQVLGVPEDHLTYAQQIKDSYASVAHETGLAVTGDLASVMVSGGFVLNQMLNQAYGRINLVTEQPLPMGFEAAAYRQLSSRYFDRLTPWRRELAFGVLLARRLRPTVRIVSSYLRDDGVGQIYVDLLNLHLEF